MAGVASGVRVRPSTTTGILKVDPWSVGTKVGGLRVYDEEVPPPTLLFLRHLPLPSPVILLSPSLPLPPRLPSKSHPVSGHPSPKPDPDLVFGREPVSQPTPPPVSDSFHVRPTRPSTLEWLLFLSVLPGCPLTLPPPVTSVGLDVRPPPSFRFSEVDRGPSGVAVGPLQMERLVHPHWEGRWGIGRIDGTLGVRRVHYRSPS